MKLMKNRVRFGRVEAVRLVHRPVVHGVVISIGVLASAVFGVVPLADARADVRADASERERLEIVLSDAQSRLAAAGEALETARADRASLPGAPPRVADLNRSFSDLLGTAERCGLSLADVSVSDPTISEGYAFGTIAVAATATPAALAEFLASLSDAHPYIAVRRIRCSSAGDAADAAGRIRVDLSLLWKGIA